MATYIPFMPIPIQLQDASGDNLSGGSLEFYLSGTTTPTNFFSDNAGTSIGTSITLNASGYPESGGNVITLFRDAEIAVKVVGKTASGATAWTADTLDETLFVLGSTTNGKGAALVSIEDSSGNFTATDVEAALEELYDNSLRNIVEDTTPELGGNLDCQDSEVQKAELKDFAVSYSAPSISSGAVTFDIENSNVFQVTLSENVTAITISNPSATGNYCEIGIRLVQDGTGSRTVAGWPASVKWPGGSSPTITTAANSVDWIYLRTVDAGTTWDGDFSQDYS